MKHSTERPAHPAERNGMASRDRSGNEESPRRHRNRTRPQSVDSAVSSPRAAMLTAVQYAELMRLRAEFDAARTRRDTAETNRLEALILAIVREGPPRIA
ncbi:MAG: hypothetical protein WD470_02245 [Rhodospirillaceae bacterium]